MNDKPTVVIPKDPKTSRDNFRLGVPTSKRHERERQRNSPRCAGKIKSRKVEKARRKGGLFYSLDEGEGRTYIPLRGMCG